MTNSNINSAKKNYKWLPLLPVIFALIGFVALKITTPEDNWTCRNGQWVAHGNPSLPMPSTLCPGAAETDISIYFSNSELTGDQTDCGLVYGVKRSIIDPSDTPRLALQQLFQGPSNAEKAQGYTSFFSSKTRDILIGIKIQNRTAYVNLKDIRTLIPNASSSCGSAQLLAQIEETLKHDRQIDKVVIAIEGNPETFYEWIQIGCPPGSDLCDPTPFEN